MHFALPFLFSRHAAASFDKQCYLASLIDSEPWHFDLASGLLSFGDKYHWHAQLLGTEADDSQTWLWAWANTGSNIPPTLLQCALQMKELGDQRLIEDLTTPQLPLDEIDGHVLSMIASGVCQANAYYRGPYEGGAAFLLIKDDAFPKHTDPPLQRIASVFPQAISNIDIPNHKLALMGHLEFYGLAHEQEGDKIMVKENGEPVLTAMFDKRNRLTKLDVTIGPDATIMS